MNFARNQTELTAELSRQSGVSVTRRSIQRWRQDPRYKAFFPKPRADGRHKVSDYLELMRRFGLNRADETVQRDELPEERRTIHDWKEHREKLMCEKLQIEIETEKKKLVPLDDMLAAQGQMLAGFMTAINMLPGNAARWVVGLKDYHAIKDKLQSEVDAVLNSLNRTRYLEDLAPAIIEKLFADRTPEFRADLTKAFSQAFIELGRQSLSDLMQQSFPESEVDTIALR